MLFRETRRPDVHRTSEEKRIDSLGSHPRQRPGNFGSLRRSSAWQGGLVLMGVLVSLLPVSGAMIVHGAVQATSNGARWLFLRRHMRWEIVLALRCRRDPGAGRVRCRDPGAGAGRGADADRRLSLAGARHASGPRPGRPTTGHGVFLRVRGHRGATPAAGASGPLLDAFFLKSSLNRYQVVASKAFTQTLGHLAKIGYYGVVVGAAADTDCPRARLADRRGLPGRRSRRTYRYAAARTPR